MKRVLFALVTFALALTLVATPASNQMISTESTLQAGSTINQRLNATITKSKIGKRGISAAHVIDMDTGKTIYTHNASRPMVPASNMKVLTSIAALEELGQDFTLKTQLYRRGSLSKGVLKGDLLLKGFGDPNISGRFNNGDVTEVLRKFAIVLRRKGIHQVTGKLYYDASYFSGPRIHEDWPKNQFNKWYEAESSALALNDNCITVKISAGKGSKAILQKIPATGYVSLSGSINAKDGRRDPKVAVVRPSRSNNQLKVWGDIYRGKPTFTAECTVHDPDAFFAHVMQETCHARGVIIKGGTQALATTANQRKEWKLTAEYASDLPTTLYVCNLRSQNLYAENLFRILGAEKAGEGSLKGGAKAVMAYLKRHDLPTSGVVLEDGSGLAKSNRLTTGLLAKLVYHIAQTKQGGIFKATLPVAGESGTLKRRLRGKNTRGRVFAKTGYIAGVYSLTGFVDTKKGKRYIFSVILNGAVSRTPVDRFVEALAA